MADTKIEWADKVWNPITGCSPCSPGCLNCYARKMAGRLAGRFGYPKENPFQVTNHPDRLYDLIHWRKSYRVFVCSMGDLFHPDVSDDLIFQVIKTALTGNRRHTYLLLTKRPGRMRQWFMESKQVRKLWHYHEADEPSRPYVSAPWPDPCLWLGVTVCNEEEALQKIPILLSIPGFKKWVSYEPALGPIRIRKFLYPGAYGIPWEMKRYQDYLSWVVAGAETGPGSRAADNDWFREVGYRCERANVPFFMKSTTGPLPDDLKIRELPK